MPAIMCQILCQVLYVSLIFNSLWGGHYPLVKGRTEAQVYQVTWVWEAWKSERGTAMLGSHFPGGKCLSQAGPGVDVTGERGLTLEPSRMFVMGQGSPVRGQPWRWGWVCSDVWWGTPEKSQKCLRGKGAQVRFCGCVPSVRVLWMTSDFIWSLAIHCCYLAVGFFTHSHANIIFSSFSENI